MGKQIYLEKVAALFEKSPVVDFKSLRRIIRKDKRKNYAKLLVHNLIKSGKIKKIGKGVYTIHNDLSLAVFAFKPAYLGLQSALSYHGIWEQETIPVIITTKKIRRGIRTIMGRNILVRNTNSKYFFGSEFVKEGDFYLPYSDIEKTYIDMIVFNQKIDKVTLKNIKSKIHRLKLIGYLKKYPLKIKKRVITSLNTYESKTS